MIKFWRAWIRGAPQVAGRVDAAKLASPSIPIKYLIGVDRTCAYSGSPSMSLIQVIQCLFARYRAEARMFPDRHERLAAEPALPSSQAFTGCLFPQLAVVRLATRRTAELIPTPNLWGHVHPMAHLARELIATRRSHDGRVVVFLDPDRQAILAGSRMFTNGNCAAFIRAEPTYTASANLHVFKVRPAD